MVQEIRVCVIGAAGRMGKEICRMLADSTECVPCAAMDISNVGKDWGSIAGLDANGITITSELEEAIGTNPDVIVDVSTGKAVVENTPEILRRGLRIIIGTTGIPRNDLDTFEKLALENSSSCLIVPNFSIGANLMIAMARKAALFFANVEVIERHHEKKKDAPSGTSLLTVSEMALANPKLQSVPASHTILDGARGGLLDEIRIHSLRLPGVLAEQTVLFGGLGETLEITHRSINRECFMPGVALSIRYIMNAEPGVVIGLDQVLEYAKPL